MVLVLAHAHDEGAAAVASTVAADLGAHEVVVLRPEVLGFCGWSHRLDAAGHAETRITLPSGGIIDSDRVDCVLNRIEYLPAARFGRASARNRDYAAVELQALLASWLASLGSRAINPADGGWPRSVDSPRRWLPAAAKCGLPTSRSVTASAGRMIGRIERGERLQMSWPWPAGPTGPAPAEIVLDDWVEDVGAVLVTGRDTTGSLAGTFGSRCRALAGALNLTLAECHFSSFDGQVVLSTLTARPGLAATAEVEAVARFVVRTVEERTQVA